ncbi:tapasin isoform X1 [Accipiter gentilis]|uniref:tapasin isoform X1 n=1 Tax=Astur gentilis TaxID=8957 RepID=UPI00210F6E04|nr:tapasin isoform X1 [Accipiter gentilis]
MAVIAALGRLLAGLCLLGWGAADVGTPPAPPPPLPCTLLGPGGGGMLPGAVSQRPTLLRFWGGPENPPNPDTSQDQDPDMTFDITDPWGALAKAWGPPWTPPHCELSPTVPSPTPPLWAPALAPNARSPAGLGGPWWVLSLGTPGYGVTALLQGQSPPATAASTALTAALSIFTLTPDLGGSPGAPLELHCAFAAPPGPFALEWRHQDRGAGRVLLTYDSATSRVPKATPGVQLLLGTTEGGVREVTLRLAPLTVAHQGTYICSIFLPHGQGQQLLRVRVLEPPKVTLHPTPLVVAPGMTAELLCDTSGYFPLDVEVRWQRRAGGSGTPLPLGDTVTETWTSGHRRGPDGTFSRSSGIRLVPARPHHHGDVYTCVVTHAAVTDPLRVHVQLEVAGAAGPWLEDVVGLCLVAFVLCGLCRWLSPAPPCLDQEPKKTQ